MDDLIAKPENLTRDLIGTNTPKVDAYCPIDGTQLVSVIEYDFSNYSCDTCGARYTWGDKSQDSLRKQARGYAGEVNERVKKMGKELANLETIVKAAKESGVLQ